MESTTDQRKLIVSEVAEALGCTRQQANRLIDAGEFGDVSQMPAGFPPPNNTRMVKAVSRERVLTYLEERKPPGGTITVKDAAKLLGCTPHWVYQLGRRGQIELVEYRIGRRRAKAVRPESVYAHLKETQG